jgi:aspartate carbamoyltransferase regulatory subunit
MPPTMEIKCTNDECGVDMFEVHLTYDMPDDTTVEDFACPYCGRTDTLEEIEV